MKILHNRMMYNANSTLNRQPLTSFDNQFQDVNIQPATFKTTNRGLGIVIHSNNYPHHFTSSQHRSIYLELPKDSLAF